MTPHSMVQITSVPLSCDEIHTENPSYPDGVYWIDPDGGGAVAAYLEYDSCWWRLDVGG